MNYIFKGNLCGLICDECREPLAGVKVRLYATRAQADVTTLAVANPKTTFAILTDAQVKGKESSLLAEVETDDEGNFSFQLGEKQRYSGGAFEIDVYCGNVPHRKPTPSPPKPLQFTITTLQPLWRQRENQSVAAWEYCIPYRYWCLIRARFGAWTICGEVTLCDTGAPLGNLRVRAFDVDWLQDDPLGAAVTSPSGHFRIDYSTSDFTPTIFPGLNLELIGGPDLYFRVETLSGSPLLVEPRSRGRDSDRENVGHCFCVKLCLKDAPPGVGTEPIPSFFALGGFDFLGPTPEIQSTVPGSGLTVGGNQAFFSTVRLNGILSKMLNGVPMEYRFEVRTTDSVGNPTGAWAAIDMAKVAPTKIGHLEWVSPAFPGDPNPTKMKDCVVKGAAPGQLVPAVVAGWIQVPQQSNALAPVAPGDLINAANLGFFVPNGNMINLITPMLAAFGSKNMTGVVAGASSTSNGATLAQDLHFALRMRVREVGNPPSEVSAGECSHVAIDNTGYDNIVHHPAWMAINDPPGMLGVCLVDIQELVAQGCAGITNQLHVLFTATHPNLGLVSISMSGPGGPYGFDLPAAVAGEQFGSATLTAPATVAGLTPCAYIVTLTVPLLLTTGDGSPLPLTDQIAFCKRL